METVSQEALTIVAEIKDDQVDNLNNLLTELGKNPAGVQFKRPMDSHQEPPPYMTPISEESVFPMAAVPSMHFCCFVIINDDPDYPPALVFETNHDGELDAHLDQILDVGIEGIRDIYSHTEDFEKTYSKSEIKEFLKARAVPSAAFYVAYRGQTVQSIQNAIQVRQEIQAYLDERQETRDLEKRSALEIVEMIQSHLLKPDVVSPVVSNITVDQLQSRSKRNTIILAIVATPIILLLSPLIILWLLLLRWREFKDNHKKAPAPLPVDPRLFENPDIQTQSHLTTMVTVRDGAIRSGTLEFVLWVTSVLAKHVSIAGNLLGIPTIHFARWAMMNNRRRMIFFSNYDGSWASYLGDFVDKAKYGLTAIWGNTDRFPASKWLMLGGAAQIIPFKEWSREHNVFAPFFYRAYPSATVANLMKDLRVRDNVGRPMNEAEAQEFLKNL